MSIFRRSFSRRFPDHLLEINERIYVFDCCLSTTVMDENEYKSYLGGVVASLRRFHPGASSMVFNFREGDQSSLLSDILIDYDMAVVDYPQDYDSYPLLPLEMIHYFLRSSESWLSLEGQKNVLLMHCEKGGWPVLAFMLSSLLLYRKKYSGEQKTLEMVYKHIPKDILSILPPINPRASQLRYLQYITGRDSYPDWPPSDKPLLVDFLLLRNLPLFDEGKGCRPVVRVYGQDPSAKGNRNPSLLFSSLMAPDPVCQYPKEELVFVKLELDCRVQGDVFLECIHLYDNLASEEIIFKVMFHTGFIPANILPLTATQIDVPWNAKHKLPKNFKAEVLFRDIDEAPLNIAMELGSGVGKRGDSESEVLFRDISEAPLNVTMELGSGEGKCHDSESKSFEVEEISTPIPSEIQEKTVESSTIIVEEMVLVDDNKNKECTLHNGFLTRDLGSQESELDSLKEINSLDEEVHKNRIEAESDVSTEESKKTMSPRWDLGCEESKVDSLKEIIPTDKGNYEQPTGEEPHISNDAKKTLSPIWNLGFEEIEKVIISLNEGNCKRHPEADVDVITAVSKKTISPPWDMGSEESEVDSSKDITPPDEEIYTQRSNAETDARTGASGDTMSPPWDMGSAERQLDSSKDITPSDKGNYKQDSEVEFVESDVSTQALTKTTSPTYDMGSEESEVDSSKDITPPHEGNYKQHSEGESEAKIGASKKTMSPSSDMDYNEESKVDSSKDIIPLDQGNSKQDSKAESYIKIGAKKKTVSFALDLGSEESKLDSSKDKTSSDEGNYKEHSEAQSDVRTGASKKTTSSAWDLGYEESECDSSKDIIDYDGGNYKQHSEAEFNVTTRESKKIVSFPRDLGSEDSKHDSSKGITYPDGGNCKQHSEAEFDVRIGASKKTTSSAWDLGYEESEVDSSKDIIPYEERNYKQHSEVVSDVSTVSSKNILVFDDGSKAQDVKVEIGQSQVHDMKVNIEPKEKGSGKPKHPKKNKWHEITAKTIIQQRVISQWVPRSKPQCPAESQKPKAQAYKWAPKGPARHETTTIRTPIATPLSTESGEIPNTGSPQ